MSGHLRERCPGGAHPRTVAQLFTLQFRAASICATRLLAQYGFISLYLDAQLPVQIICAVVKLKNWTRRRRKTRFNVATQPSQASPTSQLSLARIIALWSPDATYLSYQRLVITEIQWCVLLTPFLGSTVGFEYSHFLVVDESAESQ